MPKSYQTMCILEVFIIAVEEIKCNTSCFAYKRVIIMLFCIEVRSYSVIELQLSSFLCLWNSVLKHLLVEVCVCFRQ